jgi:epoxide hydrolase-like predicted phosphatase
MAKTLDAGVTWRPVLAIQAIVFDLGNTLFTATDAGYRDDRWEQRLGLPPGILAREFWGSRMERAALAGAVPLEEFWDWAGQTLRLSDQQLSDFDDGLWEGIVILPQVATLLERLKTRFRVAALSNAWSDARGRTEGVYGLERLVEFIAFSAEIGFAKPDPRSYMFVIEQLGMRPEQTLFVDDSAANIAAAAALGMSVVRCVDPEQMVHDVESALLL